MGYYIFRRVAGFCRRVSVEGRRVSGFFDPAGGRVDYAAVKFCYGDWAREREKAGCRQDTDLAATAIPNWQPPA